LGRLAWEKEKFPIFGRPLTFGGPIGKSHQNSLIFSGPLTFGGPGRENRQNSLIFGGPAIFGGLCHNFQRPNINRQK
jgi:hypothetical protein